MSEGTELVIFRTIFMACLALMPVSVFAVDVSAMETMLEALEKNPLNLLPVLQVAITR